MRLTDNTKPTNIITTYDLVSCLDMRRLRARLSSFGGENVLSLTRLPTPRQRGQLL